MFEKIWWKEPMQVIQYNLQVKDTGKMNPKQISEDLKEAAANVLVVNMGGIYAWYESRVPYHHVNEYLPKDRDLLADLITECHKKGIKVVGRFDFSKTDDSVYLQKPHWFVQQQDRSPVCLGMKRMGDWSLLFMTCMNSPYRNEAVAEPVLKEALEQYDIDGLFFNEPFYFPCYCDVCRQKYEMLYGMPMPVNQDEWEPGWGSRCVRDHMEKLYKLVQNTRKVPVILYYHASSDKGGNGYVENLEDRFQTADLICTEAQDILSRGVNDIPKSFHPGLNMKVGHISQNRPIPFGIIHSCPGMDWRHAGLPIAEYRYWMSQVPAYNGTIWHSLTGFNATIRDKRLLTAVKEVNENARKCGEIMKGAKSLSQILMLWDGRASAMGWAEALGNIQYSFDLCDVWHFSAERIASYSAVLIPDGFRIDDSMKKILEEYIMNGGSIVYESSDASCVLPLTELLGIEKSVYTGENLAASYLRFETNLLDADLDAENFIPYRGSTLYCTAGPTSQTLMTLVPPFAPLDAVGAPPERASIPVEKTDIPMCITSSKGKGNVLFLPFSISSLVTAFGLKDHMVLIRNLFDYLLGSKKRFSLKMPAGVQFVPYQNPTGELLLHLVNGVGKRPLQDNVPCHDLELTIHLHPGESIKDVHTCLGSSVTFSAENDSVFVKLSKLDIWEMICISFESSE